MLGNEVAVLVDEWRESGNHSIQFDGGKLTSGIYYYKLVTENFSKAKAMLLLK